MYKLEEYYSQDNQDRYLELNIFKGHRNGIFIDIGAHDGRTINNTFFFYKNRNWTGINIEPNQAIFTQLEENRPNDINLNVAIDSNDFGLSEFIKNDGYCEMISGLKNYYNEKHFERLERELSWFGGTSEVIYVKTRRLDSICREYNIKHINYLSIDVEGGEKAVIDTINFSETFIDVIGFENNYEEDSASIIEYLICNNFKIINKSLDIIMINNLSKFNQNI